MHKIIFILLSLFTTSSFAAELVDLYQSQQAVANQEDQETQRVAPEILQQVLLKVVGDREVLNAANISPILSQVDALIEQSQYRRLNKITDDLTQEDQLALLLKFSEPGVNKALSDIGLPIWSKSRPDVMVWLVVDDGKTRRILSADDATSPVVTALNDVTARRGLPILLPILDLQDQNQITATDLWAGFSEPIKKASERYAANIILTGRITMATADQVSIRWQSLINNESEQWQSKGNVNTAVQSGIEEFTDKLARRFTQVIASGAEQSLALKISQVVRYTDYSRTMNYLTNLQYVSDVQLVQFEGEKLQVKISFKGERSVFIQTLALDHILQEESSDGANTSDVMLYRLLP